MSVFLDTSAIYSVLDAGDENHARADRAWKDLLAAAEPLFTSNYILVEAFALLQNRLGLKAVIAFERDVMPVLSVEWIGESEHRAGVAALLSTGKRRLSLVDCTSFLLMNRLGIRCCFAFDPHFREQGFDCLP